MPTDAVYLHYLQFAKSMPTNNSTHTGVTCALPIIFPHISNFKNVNQDVQSMTELQWAMYVHMDHALLFCAPYCKIHITMLVDAFLGLGCVTCTLPVIFPHISNVCMLLVIRTTYGCTNRKR